MPSERSNQTLADYVALAISPALLMGLVGSLVFFLLEILYSESGAYKDRLQWILFFFVFGAVLVARISITQSASRAGLYGLVLAGSTWVGMQIYVQYPKDSAAASFNWLINLGLIGVVWWCSSRLTRDCTQIDEETEVGGEGLLQATGLEKPGVSAANEKAAAETESPTKEKDKRVPGWLIGWWERYQRFREGRKKGRVLGAWVIYFSLGALPLFGLGEALIPAEETARRQYAFWLMSLYVGSGLGLLLTTCFLSLRRYLRQRRLRMPAAMTFAWLTAGGGLIVALLVIGALLPRPRPEYSLIPYQSLGSEKLSASKYASQGGSSGKGEGNRIGDQPKDQGKPSGGDKDSQATGKDKGSPVKDKDKGGSNGEKDKDGAGKGPDKDKGSGEKGKGGDGPSKAQDKPPSKSGQPPQKDAPPAEKDKGSSQQQKQPSRDSPPPSRPQSSWDWATMLASIGMVLKWIVFAALILVVIFFLLKEGLKFLANFTDWAKNLLSALQNFWSNLFKGRVREAAGESGDDEQAERAAPARPFASYVSPFLDGRGDRLPIKEVVRYTFAALQAWARERNMERRPEETPLEFAKRLGEEFPGLETEVRRFTTLYARAAYDYSPLPGNSPEVVRQLWKRLETAAEHQKPLSPEYRGEGLG
jgi:Domain of unknown function (DUF4129)